MKKTWDVLIYDTTLRDGTQGEQINFLLKKNCGLPCASMNWDSLY